MASFTYYTAGKKVAFTTTKPLPTGRAARSLAARAERTESLTRMIASTAATKSFFRLPRIQEVVASTDASGNVTIATQTAILDGATTSAIRWMRDQHGFEVVQES